MVTAVCGCDLAKSLTGLMHINERGIKGDTPTFTFCDMKNRREFFGLSIVTYHLGGPPSRACR